MATEKIYILWEEKEVVDKEKAFEYYKDNVPCLNFYQWLNDAYLPEQIFGMGNSEKEEVQEEYEEYLLKEFEEWVNDDHMLIEIGSNAYGDIRYSQN